MSEKPTLRVETFVCFRVDSCDLQEFIKQVYGHDYDINANEDWGDDVEQTFLAGKTLDDWDHKELAIFKRTGKIGPFHTGVLLDSLVADGHIPAGTYLVCGH